MSEENKVIAPSGVEFATLDLRVAAVLIDLGILLLVMAIVIGIFNMAFANVLPTFASVFSSLLAIIFWGAYLGYFHQGPWQATPGKRMMKIHLIAENNRKIDWKLALKRAVASGGWAGIAGFIFMVIGVTTSFFDMVCTFQTLASIIMIWKAADRAAIHDKICKTWVVKGTL